MCRARVWGRRWGEYVSASSAGIPSQGAAEKAGGEERNLSASLIWGSLRTLRSLRVPADTEVAPGPREGLRWRGWSERAVITEVRVVHGE